MTIQARSIRQRSELTFKHNAEFGRHGWLRLTPAYSVKVVEDILGRETVDIAVADPFSGTGTTALAAASRGVHAMATDINPFLIWFGRSKTARYDGDTIDQAARLAAEILGRIGSGNADVAPSPPLHNIERWWGEAALDFLRQVRGTLLALCPEPSGARDLLDVAFCRVMIQLSNAAFNHQSMSFKSASDRQLSLPGPADSLAEQLESEVDRILASAKTQPELVPSILQDDARFLERIEPGSFDLLVTSPPYPNRMSYIRELRPYMYWLGFLEEARAAGELDWEAIGGTWGVATSRVGEWTPESGAAMLPEGLEKTLGGIRRSRAPNAALLANYVSKYFHDVARHLDAVRGRIATPGRVHYIVGNSTFYGTLVPTERFYADMLCQRGFRRVEVRVLRKRNSKKELFEYDVTATA